MTKSCSRERPKFMTKRTKKLRLRLFPEWVFTQIEVNLSLIDLCVSIYLFVVSPGVSLSLHQSVQPFTTCLSVHPFIYVYICLCNHPSNYLSTHSFVCCQNKLFLSVCPSVCLTDPLFIGSSVRLYINLSICLSGCQTIHLSVWVVRHAVLARDL